MEYLQVRQSSDPFAPAPPPPLSSHEHSTTQPGPQVVDETLRGILWLRG